MEMYEKPGAVLSALDSEQAIQLLQRIDANTQKAVLASQKRLFYTKIQLSLLAVGTAAILCFLLLVGPGLYRSSRNADQALENLQSITAELAQADIPALMAEMDALAKQGQDSLDAIEKAAEVLEKLDIDTLNQAVSDLQKAASPLARLFG